MIPIGSKVWVQIGPLRFNGVVIAVQDQTEERMGQYQVELESGIREWFLDTKVSLA
jgi:hypothetical protein